VISHSYGPKTENDELVRVGRGDGLAQHPSLGLFTVDFLPLPPPYPEWLPGGGFHEPEVARKWRHTLLNMTDKSYHWQFVLYQMVRAPRAYIVTNLLEGRTVSPEEEEEIKWAASSLYSGGTDTVGTSGPPLSNSSLNSHHPLSLSTARLCYVLLPSCQDNVPRSPKEIPSRARR